MDPVKTDSHLRRLDKAIEELALRIDDLIDERDDDSNEFQHCNIHRAFRQLEGAIRELSHAVLAAAKQEDHTCIM